MRRWLDRVRLPAVAGSPHRKVTWLELFFDLVFVAAVSQVGEPLREQYTAGELLRFAPLFVLIWWAWTGGAMFATRFDTGDAVQRALTLLQMFAVAIMAANATDALGSRSSAGFAAAYAGVRLVLVAQYARALHLPEARPLASRYAVGHGSAALLWLVSSLVPAPERFWIWGIAFAIDLGTPWAALRHSAAVPPSAAHLPERFGLFTIILLGEWVVAVMHGMRSQEDWSVPAATAAFLGMGIAFLVWWWYFDGEAGAAEQTVRTRRDAVRLHWWTYAHAPLYLAIFTAGVGVEHVVAAAARRELADHDALLVCGALAAAMLGLTLVGATSPARRTRSSRAVVQHVALAGFTVLAGASGVLRAPAVLVSVLAALCLAQLLVSLHGAVWPSSARGQSRQPGSPAWDPEPDRAG